MNINLYINKQSARAEAPEIFSGSQGVLTVTLFGELDSSLISVLRFMHESGEGYYTAKIENGCAIVPHEVIHAPGFSIAVAGYENDGEVIKRFLPSEAVYIPVKENGYGNPDDAVSEEEEAQSLIGQILSECQSVKGEVSDAKNALSEEVSDAKNALSKEISDAKDEMSDDILFAKEELERKYNDAKNKLDAVEGMLHEEESVRDAADKALSDALVAEAQNRADGFNAVSEAMSEMDKKVEENYVQKEEGKGLSAVANVTYPRRKEGESNTYHVIKVECVDNSETELPIYSKNQIDKKLSELPQGYTKEETDSMLDDKVSKEDGMGLSNVFDIFTDIGDDETPATIQIYKYNPINNSVERSDTMDFYTPAQIDKKLSELPQGGEGGNVDLSDYYTKEQTDDAISKFGDDGWGGFEAGKNAMSMGGCAIGRNSMCGGEGAALGAGALSSEGVAIGKNAWIYNDEGEGLDAIQLGTGHNREEKTFKVYDYTLMDANGNIPAARLANYYTKEQTDEAIRESCYYTHVFRNLANPEEFEAEVAIVSATGKISKTDKTKTYTTTGYLPVTPGDTVGLCVEDVNGFVPYSMTHLACYDQDKKVVPNVFTGSHPYAIVPDGVYFMRVSFKTTTATKRVSFEILNNIGHAPYYLEYGETLTYDVPKVDMDIRFFLPKRLYMYENHTYDLYLPAMFATTHSGCTVEVRAQANSASITYSVCDRKITFTTKEAASTIIAVDVLNAQGIRIASKRCIMTVKEPTKQAKSILAIGDSLSNNTYWLAELLRLNGNFTYVGSKKGGKADSEGVVQGNIYHDGHGGWDTNAYYNKSEAQETIDGNLVMVTNPFWDASLNGGNGGFSWAYYLNNTLNGVAPDGINFFLGMNDIGKDLDVAVERIKAMIDDILSVSGSVKIILCTPQYRDYNNSSGTISDTYYFMNKMYETFKDYASVTFVPLALYHDSEYNYINGTTTVNPRSNILTDSVSDPTHPQPSGYWQFADAIFAAMSGIWPNPKT